MTWHTKLMSYVETRFQAALTTASKEKIRWNYRVCSQ